MERDVRVAADGLPFANGGSSGWGRGRLLAAPVDVEATARTALLERVARARHVAVRSGRWCTRVEAVIAVCNDKKSV